MRERRKKRPTFPADALEAGAQVRFVRGGILRVDRSDIRIRGHEERQGAVAAHGKARHLPARNAVGDIGIVIARPVAAISNAATA